MTFSGPVPGQFGLERGESVGHERRQRVLEHDDESLDLGGVNLRAHPPRSSRPAFIARGLRTGLLVLVLSRAIETVWLRRRLRQ